MIFISTHVLDTALGRPAAGMSVRLFQVDPQGVKLEAGAGVTNEDGRIPNFTSTGDLSPGAYCLEFDTADYFVQIDCDAFHPKVEVHFNATLDGGKFHVPLLLSPYGYTTYRGS